MQKKVNIDFSAAGSGSPAGGYNPTHDMLDDRDHAVKECSETRIIGRPTKIDLPSVGTIDSANPGSYFPVTPGPASAATHFLKPKDPRSLVRSDAHIPEWGSERSILQPAPFQR